MRFRFENNDETKFRFAQNNATMFRLVNMAAWYEWLRTLMDFLWIGNIDGNKMLSILDWRYITITGKDFTGSYVPDISTATFTLPNDADYIADDLDNFWFTGGVSNVKTAAQLADSMLARTVILYNNDVPYDIHAIGLLKSTVTLTDAQRCQLAHDFQLWLFYSETL